MEKKKEVVVLVGAGAIGQAIARRVCTADSGSRRGIEIISDNAEILSLEVCDMMESNMF